MLFICTLIFFIGKLAGFETLQFLVFFIALLLLQFALFTKKDAYYVCPAICILIFAIPVWDNLNPVLLAVSDKMVFYLIRSLGISINIDSNIINLPYGKLEIADGCSGISYFLVTMVLGFLIIFTSKVNRFQAASYFNNIMYRRLGF